MSDDEEAQRRLERLRAGYRRRHRAMYGEPEPGEVPDGDLTREDHRRIAEALSLPEPELKPEVSVDPPSAGRPRRKPR